MKKNTRTRLIIFYSFLDSEYNGFQIIPSHINFDKFIMLLCNFCFRAKMWKMKIFMYMCIYTNKYKKFFLRFRSIERITWLIPWFRNCLNILLEKQFNTVSNVNYSCCWYCLHLVDSISKLRRCDVSILNFYKVKNFNFWQKFHKISWFPVFNFFNIFLILWQLWI